MSDFKQQCIALRKKDHTLLEIAYITGRPKTSVFFHVKDIPLSAKKQRQIRKKSQVLAARLALKRKGTSIREFRKFSSWKPETVCLVAHLMFDGELKSNGCIYNNRNTALLAIVEDAMRYIYTFEPKRYYNTSTGVHRIAYFNVALAAFLEQQSKGLLEEIHTLPREHQRMFLRAFFDDEGCMDYRPASHVRRIRGYQKDTKILFIIKSLLSNFEIDAQVKAPNEVVVTGKKHLMLFAQQINFSNGVLINGNRTNSRWKKSLEKRKLLSMALASFTK